MATETDFITEREFEKAIDRIEQTINKIDGRFDRLETKMEKYEGRIWDKLEKFDSRLWWMFVTLVVLIFGLYSTIIFGMFFKHP